MRISINLESNNRSTWGEIVVNAPDHTVVNVASEVRISISLDMPPQGVVRGLLTVSQARKLSHALEAAARVAEDEQKRLENNE